MSAYRLADLKVREVPLDGGADLLAYLRPGGFYFERDGCGVVALGSALDLDVPAGDDQVRRAAIDAAAALANTGGIVVGALPFDSRNDATLQIPEVAVVRRDGVTTAYLAGDAEVPAPSWPAPSQPGTFRSRPSPPQAYVRAVADATDRIRSGALDKVVLARTLDVEASQPIEVRELLARLRAADRHAYAFAVPDDGGVLVGATPELLVARFGDAVHANPLAGSARRGANGDDDAALARSLLESDKDRAEHAFVTRAVIDALASQCERIDADAQPSLLATSRVWHLSTEVRGTLKLPAASALALAAALHPTPAVCGTPADRALAAIRDLEPVDRGLYAGAVGWMSDDGDGEWAIALRCARIAGAHATLFAGSGIVAGSDPDRELAETDAKLEVLLNALR